MPTRGSKASSKAKHTPEHNSQHDDSAEMEPDPILRRRSWKVTDIDAAEEAELHQLQVECDALHKELEGIEGVKDHTGAKRKNKQIDAIKTQMKKVGKKWDHEREILRYRQQ